MKASSDEFSKEQVEVFFVKQDWQSIKVWATFQFDHVKEYRDKNNCTALHFAILRSAPMDVIDALIYAAPHLASVKTNEGELPIHFVARLGNVPLENIHKVLKSFPEGGICPNKYGKTALDIIWERYNFDFVEIYKACTVSSAPNDNFFLFYQIGNQYYGITNTNFISGSYINDSHFHSSLRLKKKQWDTILLILKAFQCHKENEDFSIDTSDFRPFHIAVGSPAPLALTAFLYPLNIAHLKEKNQMGRLPLSIAASSKDLNNNPNLCNPLLEHLLNLHPEAVSIQDKKGKVPLTLAIESGKTWSNGIGLLVKIEPRAISTRDELSRLYPFMVASIVMDGNTPKEEKKEIELVKMDLTYRLLKENPECIRIGIPDIKSE